MADKKIITDELLKLQTEKVLQVIADNVYQEEEYLEQEIDDMFDATPQEISYYESLINPDVVSENRLWSSKTIDEKLASAILEANKYTDQASTRNLTTEIVSSTADVTKENVLYLILSDASTNTYEQYMLIGGTATALGSTQVDLSNIYNKSEIDSKLDDKANKSEVLSMDSVQATTGSETNDTVYTSKLTKDELAKKIDKTSILIAKNNSATDDQVYSAKSINTELDGVVKKTDIIDNLTSTDTDKPLSANQGKILNDKKLDKADVGKITVLNANGVDIKDFILEKCTEKFKEYHIISTPTCTDIPANNYFYMIVRRTGNNTFKVTAKEANSTNEYVRNYRSDAAIWTKWAKVCTTTVEDIPKTNIAPVNETAFVNFKGNSLCNYCVENGVCYVSLWGVQVTVTGRVNTGVMLPLPKSGFFGGGELVGGGDAEIHAYAHTIPETGELKFNVKDANIALYGSFSYPVAE